MAGLNVSLSFFFIVVAVCEAARRLSKRSLPAPVYGNLARELIGAFQLGACCLELRMLVVIGPWGGGYGPDVILTLLFLLFLVHGLTWDGASANPITSLREFLTAEASAPVAAVRAAAHLAGTYAGDALTRLYWSWELTDFHLIQNLMGRECSSALQTAVAWGVLVEATCAFFYHLTLLCFQHSRPLYRAPAVALIVTLLAYTAGPFTSAFFNPALASAVTFHCSGNTLLEYVQVYWLGPAAGMVTALLLHQGNIPRLFRRNLLYSQRSKYRAPKAKLGPSPGPQPAGKQEKTRKKRAGGEPGLRAQ
ncbi:aquaporin-12-like [Ornithorhynchus anatinus]|uniref:aquaporin-12-like n=1 Tax=Ornithorhynchus anatinus TaxID=9258 RepID=UPI0010A91AA9|nr:aquaporin-12-like [Ornithorhynchus anatinus]